MCSGVPTPGQDRLRRLRFIHGEITRAGWTTLEPTAENETVIRAQYDRLLKTQAAERAGKPLINRPGRVRR